MGGRKSDLGIEVGDSDERHCRQRHRPDGTSDTQLEARPDRRALDAIVPYQVGTLEAPVGRPGDACFLREGEVGEALEHPLDLSGGGEARGVLPDGRRQMRAFQQGSSVFRHEEARTTASPPVRVLVVLVVDTLAARQQRHVFHGLRTGLEMNLLRNAEGSLTSLFGRQIRLGEHGLDSVAGVQRRWDLDDARGRHSFHPHRPRQPHLEIPERVLDRDHP